MAVRRLRCTDYRVLDDEQIHRVHLAVLEILEDTGVFIEHEPALKIFADCGCRVDFDTSRVCIPEHVLNQALSTQEPISVIQQSAFDTMIYVQPTLSKKRIDFTETGVLNVLAYTEDQG